MGKVGGSLFGMVQPLAVPFAALRVLLFAGKVAGGPPGDLFPFLVTKRWLGVAETKG